MGRVSTLLRRITPGIQQCNSLKQTSVFTSPSSGGNYHLEPWWKGQEPQIQSYSKEDINSHENGTGGPKRQLTWEGAHFVMSTTQVWVWPQTPWEKLCCCTGFFSSLLLSLKPSFYSKNSVRSEALVTTAIKQWHQVARQQNTAMNVGEKMVHLHFLLFVASSSPCTFMKTHMQSRTFTSCWAQVLLASLWVKSIIFSNLIAKPHRLVNYGISWLLVFGLIWETQKIQVHDHAEGTQPRWELDAGRSLNVWGRPWLGVSTGASCISQGTETKVGFPRASLNFKYMPHLIFLYICSPEKHSILETHANRES